LKKIAQFKSDWSD